MTRHSTAGAGVARMRDALPVAAAGGSAAALPLARRSQIREIARPRLRGYSGAIAILAAAQLLIGTSAPAAEAKRVLLIQSFGNASPQSRAISLAFEKELVAKIGEPVDLDQFSLDMARYPDGDSQAAVVDYLQKRQIKWRPDIVVTMAAPAAAFVAAYRDRLFADIPIIYASLDRRLLPPGALEQNAVYIGQEFRVPGWIEDILQIAPATKNIEVVVGATPLERNWKELFQKAAEPFTGRIKFTYYDDLPFVQTLERLAKLPPHSYILVILMLRDAAGVTHATDDALQRLHQVANAPINSIFSHQLGLGIVGGRLYQSDQIGREAANAAIRILHGEPVSSFDPLKIEPLPPRYDWRELERWKIDQKLLPPNSAVLYQPPSLWEEHRAFIIGVVSICLLQALLITSLLINRIRRKRAELSLVESEKRFKATADAAPVLMWMTGEDKLCNYVNKAWLDFTGQSLEHELGNGWSESIYPDDRENALQTYVDAFDEVRPFAMQYRLRRHDGEYRWITDQGTPRHGPDGDFRGYVGACVDITDLLKKETALRQFEERVALAAEAAQHGVWELDVVTNKLWVSDTVRSLFQLHAAEPTYEDVQARVHPEDRAARDTAIKEALRDKGEYELEYRVVLPDGTIRWMSGRGRCITNAQGECTRLLGVSVDVTKRKQAEELFRLATEASPSGTLLIDEQGQIILVNAHVEELFGYKREELINQQFDVLISDRFWSAHPGQRARLFADLQSRELRSGWELYARRKDGTEFPVEVSLNPIETPKGLLVLASVVDISPRKAAEEEARRNREQIHLLSRVSLLGEMTASLAHELNQPLTAIITNANAGRRMMDRGVDDPEMLHEILVAVASDGRRAHDIIQNVRNTVKKGAEIRQQIDLNELVTRVARVVRPDAFAYSCVVDTQLDSNLPLVEGDPIQLQQVLVNLVSNAFDAMREAPVDQRRVEISTSFNGNGEVRLGVRDHGTGIRSEAQDRLFDQFFSTKEQGLGMGLAIVRSIVEAHGGQIEAENVIDGGARFYFDLPISKQGRA